MRLVRADACVGVVTDFSAERAPKESRSKMRDLVSWYEAARFGLSWWQTECAIALANTVTLVPGAMEVAEENHGIYVTLDK